MGSGIVTIQKEAAIVMVEDSCHRVCPTGDTRLLIPVGVQGDPGQMTLAQFTVLMNAYNAALPSYPSEEAAALGGLVSGDEFIWSADTDVGIAGDKHIMS